MSYIQQQDGDVVQPKMKGYKMRCCDCGLVHKIDFFVVKHGRGHKVRFQVWRDQRSTAAGRRGNKDTKHNGAVPPIDPKLSDGRGWRDRCAAGERWRQEAAGVTAAPVRCSAWLGVAVIGIVGAALVEKQCCREDGSK